ncbi:transposase [Salinibacter ruber]|uniref:IS110 family transposase n=1 Tax=Salinibacter ruber TaxID=146919 RepID=UPI0021697F3A|nr:IS110 family transposase [Salinibacter ruber]MCS4162931.1 transposase [Salinibacter ruber]
MNVYVGGDVSKGYADFCLMDGEGEILLEIQLDDTRQGHSQMRKLICKCNRKVGPEEELEIALEATGGMERNWLHLFQKLDEADEADLNVYRFNPLVIRRFTEQRLHTNKTDEISARVLADYLRLGLAEKKAAYTDEGPDDGLKTLSRKTQRMVNQSIDLQNELQALLQRAHPELVQYVRGHMSQWVLRLIKRYPTPDQVVEAGLEALIEIPYVTEKKAKKLVEAARTTVASQTDEDTGLTLSLVAEDLLRLEKRIDRLKERLWNRVRDRRAPRIIASIEGIGKWSAAVLYCEIGDITRFSSAKKLIAYAGLDPQREESGDIAREKTISKQGSSHIRSVLYGCVTAAIRNGSNPPVRDLYDRLKERGKHQKVAEVACMRKLLAIVYGCWSNNERFDPTYEKRLKARQAEKKSTGEASSEQAEGQSFDMSAPVSRKEAKKRRKATSPEKSVSPSARGQGAFLDEYHNGESASEQA